MEKFPGYRHIHYNPRHKKVVLWTWDSEGNRIEKDIPFKPYLFVESSKEEETHKSIFNTSLRKLTFDNSFDRSNFVRDYPSPRIFGNYNAEQQALLDLFWEQVEQKDTSLFRNPLRITYFDIETYSPNGFPDPQFANDTINVITVYDSLLKKYFTWGIDCNNQYVNNDPEVEYIPCKSEKILLLSFLRFWRENFPDIVTAHNLHGFDLPYIITRISKLFDEDTAKKLSPIQQCYYREDVYTRFGKSQGRWNIQGLSCLDYLDVYQGFNQGQLESYSLNYIVEHELKEQKKTYNESSLWELADKNWQTFVEYNIQDVKLLVSLERKLKYFDLIRSISYRGCINFENALAKTSLITGCVSIQAYKKNRILSTFKNVKEKEEYAGGFVKEPQRGLKGPLVTFDANSLYPNTIITLNISPETKVGKIIHQSDSETKLRLSDGSIITLKQEDLEKFQKEKNLSLSKSGVFYTQKNKGICADFVQQLYNDRVEMRKELQKVKQKLKENPDNLELNNKRDFLQTSQLQTKIILNSLYGQFAQPYSPFFDIDNASSITLTGQAVVKASSQIIDEFARDRYGLTLSGDNTLTIGQDTDSCFVSLKEILQKKQIPFQDDKGNITKESYQVIDELSNHLNEKITEWAKRELNSLDPRYIFKREAICDVGFFQEKKRYILHILDEEGIVVDKFKYVGVEIKRSTFSKQSKEFIKEIIEKGMLSQEEKICRQLYINSFKKYEALGVEDLSLRSSMSDLDKHIDKEADPTILQFQKGTPCHVKASIAYNFLLKHLKLENKYEPLSSGMKIKYFYVKKNQWGIEAIAFPNIYPEEFKEYLEVDYRKMFSKVIEPPIERFFTTIGWSLPDLDYQTTTDLLDLFS